MLDSLIVFCGLSFVRLILGIASLIMGGSFFSTNILFQYTLKDILLYVLQVLYFMLCTYYTGTTLGKKALNLRVVRADGEEKLRLLDVVYRETIGRFLCGISMGIGYIMAGIDQEKKGLHDLLCDTRVVYLKKIKVKTVFPPAQDPVMNTSSTIYHLIEEPPKQEFQEEEVSKEEFREEEISKQEFQEEEQQERNS